MFLYKSYFTFKTDSRGRLSLQQCAICSRIDLQTHLMQTNFSLPPTGRWHFHKKMTEGVPFFNSNYRTDKSKFVFLWNGRPMVAPTKFLQISNPRSSSSREPKRPKDLARRENKILYSTKRYSPHPPPSRTPKAAPARFGEPRTRSPNSWGEGFLVSLPLYRVVVGAVPYKDSGNLIVK